MLVSLILSSLARDFFSTVSCSSSQVLSEATEDNLIDLGPGSPAVVSNMVNAASTNLPSTNVVGPSSPATLASRLAGLGLSALSQTFDFDFYYVAVILLCLKWIMYRMCYNKPWIRSHSSIPLSQQNHLLIPCVFMSLQTWGQTV